MKIRIRIPLKIKLFLPVSIIIIIVVTAATLLFINRSINAFNEEITKNLQLEIETISKIFEQEFSFNLEKVQTNLRVAHMHFYDLPLEVTNQTYEMEVEDQVSGDKHIACLREWQLDGKPLSENKDFVNNLTNIIIGGTIAIFQEIDSGFVRISTNEQDSDSTSVSRTFIPNNSPMSEAIRGGEIYYGLALVMDKWHTTACEPINLNDTLVGMLYVGNKENDMGELKRILSDFKIGKSGYPFVFDNDGNMLIHPYLEGGSWCDSSFFKQMQGSKEGFFDYKKDRNLTTVAYKYFDKLELYIAALIVPKIENREFVHNAIIGAATIGVLSILLLMALIYRFTTERLYRYFSEWQIAKKKLATAELALKHSEKLANMGQISAGIVHELNNPLGIITMYSNILINELNEDDPMRKDLELIAEQALRCKNIVGGLLNFARKNKLNINEVDIVDFIKRSLQNTVIPANVKVNINGNISNPMIMMDDEQMLHAITNLEKNAVEAMPDGGTLNITIDGDNDNIQIRIADTGTGIAKENIEKLFTPFFTTKEAGKGTGLGLSLVYGIIKIHKGKIAVSSNDNPKEGPTGTEFIITLPRIN